MHSFEIIKEKLLHQLEETCPDLQVKRAFDIQYEAKTQDSEARLTVTEASELDRALVPYALNKAAALIERLKNIGTEEGLYTPANDGRFHMEISEENLAAIIAKQTSNAKFMAERFPTLQPGK